MKIAITGHTRGIGKALADHFADAGHSVVGLSRTNGYNIADTDKLVHLIKDCDMFINNAHLDEEQTTLLESVYNLWKDTDKIIVSIGSAVTAYPKNNADLNQKMLPYKLQKQSLKNKFRELAWRSNTCHMALISPGPIDTPASKRMTCAKLTPEEVVNAVDLVVSNRTIKELTVFVK